MPPCSPDTTTGTEIERVNSIQATTSKNSYIDAKDCHHNLQVYIQKGLFSQCTKGSLVQCRVNKRVACEGMIGCVQRVIA